MMRPAEDKSNGYEACAQEFIDVRNPKLGVESVREWARTLPRGASVLDLGCGFGVPISQLLIEQGFDVYGVDASSTLIAEYRRRFPSRQAECTAAEDSAFFNRQFDGILAWGLLFLLTPRRQATVIAKVSEALKPGGGFLFTAPRENCCWQDSLTGRTSFSLGAESYRQLVSSAGMRVLEERSDEGGNYYYWAIKARER